MGSQYEKIANASDIPIPKFRSQEWKNNSICKCIAQWHSKATHKFIRERRRATATTTTETNFFFFFLTQVTRQNMQRFFGNCDMMIADYEILSLSKFVRLIPNQWNMMCWVTRDATSIHNKHLNGRNKEDGYWPCVCASQTQSVYLLSFCDHFILRFSFFF